MALVRAKRGVRGDELQKRAKYLPKRFALLPMWKHQPAFVKYGATQFAQVPMVRDSALRPKDVSVNELVQGALDRLHAQRAA